MAAFVESSAGSWGAYLVRAQKRVVRLMLCREFGKLTLTRYLSSTSSAESMADLNKIEREIPHHMNSE